MYDPSRYDWKKRNRQPTSTFANEIDSQITPLYKSIDANMYPNDVYDYESGFAIITQSISVPQMYKQATSTEFLTI